MAIRINNATYLSDREELIKLKKDMKRLKEFVDDTVSGLDNEIQEKVNEKTSGLSEQITEEVNEKVTEATKDLDNKLEELDKRVTTLENLLGTEVDFTTEYNLCSFENRDIEGRVTTITIEGKAFSINSRENHYRGEDYYAPTISVYDGVHYLRIFNRFGINTSKNISTVVITFKDKSMADDVVNYINDKGNNGVGVNENYWCEVISQEDNTLTIDVSNLVKNKTLDYIFGHSHRPCYLKEGKSLLIKSVKIY